MISKTPAICILDAYTTNPGDLSWKPLQTLGKCAVYDRTPREKILHRAQNKEIIILNKAPLSPEHLQNLPDCKLICLLSTGTNAVDLELCQSMGIAVCNIPAYSTPSVSELVLAYLAHWSRDLTTYFSAVAQSKWSQQPDFTFTLSPQRELRGLTLGLVGFGSIAQAVCSSAHAIGMNVISTTPHPDQKPALGQQFTTLDHLYAQSDVISLHCPLTTQTRHLINAHSLKNVKKGAVLINTSRGGLIDEEAVATALSNETLSAAYLDVLSQEPPPARHPLIEQPNAYITPHIGWATRAARQRLLDILVQNIQAFLKGTPQNLVTTP